MKEVNIYIATSFRSPKKKSGYTVYLIEYFRPGMEFPAIRGKYELVEDSSKNRAELTALETALGKIKEKCVLKIYTESEYIHAALGNQGRIKGWKENGWKNSKNVAVKNQDKWKKIEELLYENLLEIALNEPNQYVKLLHMNLEKLEKGELALEDLNGGEDRH